MKNPTFLTVFTVVLALATFQFSDIANAEESDKDKQKRYYYTGTIGSGNKVQMELLFESEDVAGSYYYDKKGVPLALTGTYNPKDLTIKLGEKGEKGLITGTFTGKVKSEGADSAKTIEGEWSRPKGDKKLPFKLTKVADFVSKTVSDGDKIESSILYPKFVSGAPALNMINTELSKNMNGEQSKFLREAREFFSEEDSSGGWEEDRSYSIAFYSQGLISLTGIVYSYTGGAHGNTYFLSSNYMIKDGKASQVKLSDLFKPGSNYLKALSSYCINDLLLQGAGWVVNGEIKSFKEEELGVFAFSPEGIKFAFAPYAVGPYSEGAYFVTVTFRELGSIIKPKGPLGKLAGLTSN